MMTPSSAVIVPMSDDQTTNENHSAWCFRSGVKYSQCGMAPRYAQNARRRRRVLHDVGGGAVDVDLLAVGPGVFVERPQVAQAAADRPLIDLFDGLLRRLAQRSPGPRRGRAIDHRVVDGCGTRAIVGVDHGGAATPAATRRHRARPPPPKRYTGRPSKLVRRICAGGCSRPSAAAAASAETVIARDRASAPLETIVGADAREAPVHHHDAGDEPEQEDDRQRDAQPAVDEDQRALQQYGWTRHAIEESRRDLAA